MFYRTNKILSKCADSKQNVKHFRILKRKKKKKGRKHQQHKYVGIYMHIYLILHIYPFSYFRQQNIQLMNDCVNHLRHQCVKG